MPAEPVTTSETTDNTAHHAVLLAQLEETRGELAKARDDLHSAVRTLAVDRALVEAGVTSIAAARTKLADTPGTDPAALVAALRAREPALFVPRPRVAPGLSTSAPRTADDPGHAAARTVTARAAAGDRRALMDYMRLRRAAV